MQIKRISLQNFKCFKKLDLELSKITLLTGKNSSGKSSLVDAILGIFQSGYPFYLSPNGKYVDMGDFAEMVFNHDKEKDITVDVSIAIGKSRTDDYHTVWDYDVKTKMPVLRRMSAESELCKIRINRTKRKYLFNFTLNESKYKKSKRYELDKIVPSVIEAVISSSGKEEEKKDLESFMEGLDIKAVKDFSFSDLKTLRYKLITEGYSMASMQLQSCISRINSVEEDLNYIGAFRIQPERMYSKKAKLIDKIGKFGDNCFDLVLEWKDDMLPEYRELVQILRGMGMLHEIGFRKSSGGRFEPRVKIKEGGVRSSLIDVGFGISQLLPIVVADLQMPEGSTLVVAQPEMHLHTNAQADLASYFIKQVKGKNKKYILETHSEYILNRIRAAIVKGTISPKEVAVYYFDNSVDGSENYKITLSKDGQILGAPDGFFDTYQMEVMDIAMNAQA